MSYSKHKDSIPEDTLVRIKEVLKSTGISLNHILHKRLDGVYSAIVYDAKNWWSTGGKGTTEAYCLASGYAEAMEHLCNYCAFNYRAVDESAVKYGGFTRYPDETKVSINDALFANKAVFEDIFNSFSNDGTAFDLENCEKCWTLLFGSRSTTIVPFYSVKSKNVVLLPDEIIGRLSGSTGGGAGNTPYEALSHAFDEICERYAKYQIYSKKLTPPEISRDYIEENCNDLFRLIEQIERRGYRVIIKDASLGQAFPVVSVAVVNPDDQSYMVKFGAHCCFNIALERCITEMFQSYSLDSKIGNGHKTFHRWSYNDDKISSYEGNWFTQLKDDSGAVPNSYFLKNASWKFEPWGLNNEYTNKSGVLSHIVHFKDLGCKDIFIRDLSFLGFPVYKVYIPEYSYSHLSINERMIGNFLLADRVIAGIKKKQIDNNGEFADVLLNCFSKDSYIGGMILKNIEEQIIEICYAALDYDVNNSLSVINDLSNTNRYAHSVLLDNELARKGYSSREREELFSALADEKTSAIIRCFRGDNVFINLIRTLDKNTRTEADSIKWERYNVQNVSKTHIRFKQMMIENMPNQNDIHQLLEPR